MRFSVNLYIVPYFLQLGQHLDNISDDFGCCNPTFHVFAGPQKEGIY